MADVEFSDRARGAGVFPRRWIERGVTPGEGEAALSGWIRANIVEDRAMGIGRRAVDPRLAHLELLAKVDPSL